MNLWFFVWLILSVALLYFLAWTLLIIFRQKKAWKAFAKKNRLRFRPMRFQEAPEMEGTIKGYTISFFTSEHEIVEGRTSRKMTAIEINLSSKMPISGAVASGKLVDSARVIVSGYEEYRPKHKDWDDEYIICAEDKGILAEYLKEERLAALIKLMKMKGNWAILAFKGDVMILRVDTPLPLDTVKELNEIVNAMIKTAQILELAPGEGSTLKSKSLMRAADTIALDIEEGEETPAFELEEGEE